MPPNSAAAIHPIRLGPVSVDPVEYAIQGNAILGIRDSGKSYTGSYMAERLMDAKIPIVAFDPIGVWRWLRVAGKGRGYPVVVAGGEQPDLPLTPQGAPEIVRAAMREGVSIVIDLFSMKLNKADWRRIVEAAVRTLLYENKRHGLRHVFIEEAAEFVPQNLRSIGSDNIGSVYAEVEKLVRMGRNAGLGCTLINPRAEGVNKEVLELCDMLFLHRQRGRRSLENVGKWLDMADAQGGKAIRASLSTLPQGDCWVWPAGSDTPVRVHVPEKRTFHPNPRDLRGESTAPKNTADVSRFVSHMETTLSKLVEEAAANDPKLLKAKIAELERARAGAPKVASKAELKEEYDRGFGEGAMKGERDGYLAAMSEFTKTLRPLVERGNALIAIGNELGEALHAIAPALAAKPPPAKPRPSSIPHPAPVRRAPQPAPKPVQSAAVGELSKGERTCLTVIAQHPAGVTRQQLTILTGYKRSTRDAYIQRLLRPGYIEASGDRIVASQAGIAALGPDFEPLPTGDALREHWLGLLPEGERRVLEVLIEHHPDPVERVAIDDRAGLKRSTRDAYLQRLKARELIENSGSMTRASDMLFGAD